VLEIGDSLGNDLGWGLNRQFAGNPGMVLVQKDKSSTGLTNSWFYDWPSHLATYLRQYHPHLVLVCIGGNDARDVSLNGHVVRFGTPEWIKFYDFSIRQIVTEANKAGARILWVGLPIMRPFYYRQEIALLNARFAHVAPSVPGGTYLPTWSLMATSSGAFRQSAYVNHVWATLRSPDGIHLSSVGENVFSTFVAREIGLVYHVNVHLAAPSTITG
jgi:hypothetical protein